MQSATPVVVQAPSRRSPIPRRVIAQPANAGTARSRRRPAAELRVAAESRSAAAADLPQHWRDPPAAGDRSRAQRRPLVGLLLLDGNHQRTDVRRLAAQHDDSVDEQFAPGSLFLRQSTARHDEGTLAERRLALIRLADAL